jgi:hypothetical protein
VERLAFTVLVASSLGGADRTRERTLLAAVDVG